MDPSLRRHLHPPDSRDPRLELLCELDEELHVPVAECSRRVGRVPAKHVTRAADLEDRNHDARGHPRATGVALRAVRVQKTSFWCSERLEVKSGVERGRRRREAARREEGEVVPWVREVERDEVDEVELERLREHARRRVERVLDVLLERRNGVVVHDAKGELVTVRTLGRRFAAGCAGALRPVRIATCWRRYRGDRGCG